jgi:hypothetical protein
MAEGISVSTTPAAPAASAAKAAAAEKLRRRLLSPLALRFYFLAKLPLALFAGLRVRELSRERCVTSVPYGWRSTNPFRSTYFAAQAMAAELSTGSLALFATLLAPESVALLIVGMDAVFEKKATALTTFTCREGAKIFAAVEETLRTGEGTTAEVETIGTAPDGTVVARFHFRWSFRRRSKR